MSAVELTSKIQNLSVEDYNMVVMLVDRLSDKSVSIQRKSADELFAELTTSAEKSDMGQTTPAHEVSKSMREKYAV